MSLLGPNTVSKLVLNFCSIGEALSINHSLLAWR
jgi:hypothetical protein